MRSKDVVLQWCECSVCHCRIKALETERQSKKCEVISLEKSQEVLRVKVLELERSLESSRAESVGSQRELAEYRAKARKILEEKEKFISTLRAGGHTEDQSELRQAEVEQMSRERNLYQEETFNLAAQLVTARQELASCEERLQREENSQHCLLSDLNRRLHFETERREELESEVSRQAEELRYTRLAFLKTFFQRKIWTFFNFTQSFGGLSFCYSTGKI